MEKLLGWMVLNLVLLGCGGSSEALPIKKGQTVEVKLAIVGESFSWCDASEAWRKTIHLELLRVTRRKIFFNLEYDQAHANNRPDLLTLENFWNSSLGNYWIGIIPPDSNSVRYVALPPLVDSSGRKMYGGMHYGKGILGSWFYTNVEPGNQCRNAFTFIHEFGHSLGMIDLCHPNRQSPDVMCWEDAPIFRDCKAPIRYNAIQERHARRKLGLRVAGKTLVIGK